MAPSVAGPGYAKPLCQTPLSLPESRAKNQQSTSSLRASPIFLSVQLSGLQGLGLNSSDKHNWALVTCTVRHVRDHRGSAGEIRNTPSRPRPGSAFILA